MKLPYAELLLTTYADRRVAFDAKEDGFSFTILNPEWEEGAICVVSEGETLTLHFADMHEDFSDDFGELIEMIDALLADETMIFTILSQGKEVLGGSRGTDEIDIDHNITHFVRSLSDGDPALHAELKAIIARGNCQCRLRGFRRARNRTFLLS